MLESKADRDRQRSPDERFACPETQERIEKILGYWAKRLPENLISRCELRAVLWKAAWEAALAYDPSGPSPASFVSYMTFRLQGAVKDELRVIGAWGLVGGARPTGGRKRPNRPYSLSVTHDEAGIASDRPERFAESLPTDEEPVGWEVEYEDFVESLSRRCSKQSRDVVQAMYLWADTRLMKQAGTFLGISESRTSQLHTRAIEQIKGAL